MKKIINKVLLSVLFLALIISCNSNDSVNNSEINNMGHGLKIIFDTGGPVGGSYSTIVQNGAKQASMDLGVEVEFLYSDWSPQKMVENFKKSLASQADGIVIMGHPGDQAYAPFIKEAMEKGIIVTSADTELPQMKELYKSRGFGYTGVKNYERGRSLAAELVQSYGLKVGDRALVWGLKSLPTRGLSSLAIVETLEKKGIIVDYMEISPEVDKDSALGIPLFTAYVSSSPDCVAVIMDHGALTAQLENFFRAADIGPDEMIGAGFSLSPSTATAIKNGYVDLVGDGQPFLQGYLPVLQIVLTKKYGFSGLNIETGGGFIHKENIDLIAPLAKIGIR